LPRMTEHDTESPVDSTDKPVFFNEAAPEGAGEPSQDVSAGARPPSPSGGRRTLLMVVAAVAVAAVVILAALFVVGIGPFARTSGSSSNDIQTGETFAVASVAAATAASHFGPGPWHPLLAAGADPSVPVLESTVLPASEFSSVSSLSCSGSAEASDPSVGFPGFDGDLTLGLAPSWLFVEMNATGTMLFEFVLGGNATPVELYTGPGCTALELLGTLPNWTVDSSTAMSAAMADGGTAFVHAHPGGSTTFVAADIGGSGEWQVSYTTCPPVGNASASQTYYAFVANVSLDTGVVMGSPTSGSVSCHGLDLSGPLSSAASHAASGRLVQSWGPPLDRFVHLSTTLYENHTGSFAYTIKVNSATGVLHWSDLQFTIRNSTGEVPRGPWGVNIYATSGCIIATGALDDSIYVGNIFGLPGLGYCTSGVTGGGALVGTGETASVLSNLNLTGTGATLQVYGGGSYSGNQSWVIP